ESGRSTTRPRPWRSVTTLATVVRESPVSLTRSLRLTAARLRSTSTTSARLTSRRFSSCPISRRPVAGSSPNARSVLGRTRTSRDPRALQQARERVLRVERPADVPGRVPVELPGDVDRVGRIPLHAVLVEEEDQRRAPGDPDRLLRRGVGLSAA